MGWWHDFTSSQPWVEWINDRTLKPLSEYVAFVDPSQNIIKASAWVMDKSIELVAKPLSKIAYKPVKEFENFIHFTPLTGNFQSLDRWQRELGSGTDSRSETSHGTLCSNC